MNVYNTLAAEEPNLALDFIRKKTSRKVLNRLFDCELSDLIFFLISNNELWRNLFIFVINFIFFP